MAKKRIAIGVNEGGGPPPGYLWGVALLGFVDKESDFLSEDQRKHFVLQLKDLATHEDPTHSDTLSLRPIEDFHELRDWGGILGGLNVRIFYGVDKQRRQIVVLGLIKKKNNGPTLLGDKVRMRSRWRRYQNGEFGYA